MRIAYLFCGHSRTWERCYNDFFNNVFSQAPGDIYIHTWDRVSCKTGSYWNGWLDLTGENLALATKLADVELIKRTYNPTKMVVEPDQPIDDNQTSSDIKYRANLGVKIVLSSARKVFEMARDNGPYDRMFLTRLDIQYTNKFDTSELYSDKLICSRNDHLIEQGATSDLWMVGSQDQIDIRTQYLNRIDDYWYNIPDYNHHAPELYLSKYLRDSGIQYQASTLMCNIPRIFGPDTRFTI